MNYVIYCGGRPHQYYKLRLLAEIALRNHKRASPELIWQIKEELSAKKRQD